MKGVIQMETAQLKPFRWCFIGTGLLGTKVAKQIRESGRHLVTACWSRNAESRRAFAAEHHCKAYESAAEAISAPDVDGVYVVTPHNAHFRFVKEALELGKPVLCEKPFTVEAADTAALIGIAAERELYLCEAMWTWFAPGALQVKKWLDDGEIGTPRTAKFTYCCNSLGYASRIGDPARAGGALLDIGIYPVTYAYRLWGKPEKMECTANIQNGVDLEDHILFTYPSGLTVDIRTSAIDKVGDETMEIIGDQGSIVCDAYHHSSEAQLKRAGRLPVSTGFGFHTYLREFDVTAEEIRRGLKESEYVPLHFTLEIMELMDEIRGQIGLSYDCLE